MSPFARLAAARKSLPDDYWIVWFGTLINRMGGFVAPVLTFYLIGERGMSVGRAGLVVSLFGAGSVIAALVGGVLADRLGRRATMLLSLWAGGVAMASLGFQRAEAAIAVNTFALGFAGELYRPAVMAFVGDVVPPEHRLRAFGYLYWVINLSFAFAAVVGGLVSRWSYTALFLIDAATMFGFATIIAVRLPESRPAPASDPDGAPRRAARLLDVLTDRTFMTFWLLAFGVAFLLYQCAVPLSAHFAAQGYDQGDYGAVLAVNGVLIVLLQPLATARTAGFDRSRVLAVAALLTGGGFALHGVSAWLAMHVVAIAVWTVGEIIAAPINSTVVANLSSADARGRYQGTFGMSFGLASMLGPLVGAAVLDRGGPGVLWGGCLGLGVVLAAGYLVTARGRRARGA